MSIPLDVQITMTLWWARWRLKSPASRLFIQSFIQTQVKVNIKASRHWSLCGEFTGDRWIPRTNGQLRGKYFHLMTSSRITSRQFFLDMDCYEIHSNIAINLGYILTLSNCYWTVYLHGTKTKLPKLNCGKWRRTGKCHGFIVKWIIKMTSRGRRNLLVWDRMTTDVEYYRTLNKFWYIDRLNLSLLCSRAKPQYACLLFDLQSKDRPPMNSTLINLIRCMVIQSH